MAWPVVTVAAGGLPVIDVTGVTPRLGRPVTEAVNGRGTAVTKVLAFGLPVTFVVMPPFERSAREEAGGRVDRGRAGKVAGRPE